MAIEILSQAQPWQQLLALVLAATVVMGSPGPATISVTAIGAAFGLRNSLRYAWGIILGTVAVLLVVATGITAILTSMPGVARAGGRFRRLYPLSCLQNSDGAAAGGA